MQRAFGGKDTAQKLQTVADYLNFYTIALSKHSFRLKYLDAFAGTGRIPHAGVLPLLSEVEEEESFVEGSARRALRLRRPFDEYHFSEKASSKAKELELLKEEFPALASTIRISKLDANEAVARF